MSNLIDNNINSSFTLDDYIKIAFGYHIDYVNPISNFTNGCWLESIIMYLYSINDSIGDYMTNYLDFFYLKMLLCENIIDSNSIEILPILLKNDYFDEKFYKLINNNIYINFKLIKNNENDYYYEKLNQPIIYKNNNIYNLFNKLSQLKINLDNKYEKNKINSSIYYTPGHFSFRYIYNNNIIEVDNIIKKINDDNDIKNNDSDTKYYYINKTINKINYNIFNNNTFINLSLDYSNRNNYIDNLKILIESNNIIPNINIFIYDYNLIIKLNDEAIILHTVINNIIYEYKISRSNIKYQQNHLLNNGNHDYHYNCKYNYILNLLEKELNNIIYLNDKQLELFYKNLLYIVYKYNKIINNENDQLLKEFKKLLIYYTDNFNIIINNNSTNNIYKEYNKKTKDQCLNTNYYNQKYNQDKCIKILTNELNQKLDITEYNNIMSSNNEDKKFTLYLLKKTICNNRKQ